MTKIEQIKNLNIEKDVNPFEVMDCDCPRDWGLQDCDFCSLQTGENIDNWECLKCWMSEVEDDR